MNQEIMLIALILGINFMVTMIYLFFLGNEARKRRFFQMPALLQKSMVLLFVGPLFVAPFLAQPRIHVLAWDWLGIPLGLLLICGGVIFIIMAFLKIGVVPSLREKSVLITTGIYGIVRHPIYAGTILAFVGTVLCTGAVVALYYVPVSIGLYFAMAVHEEKSLKAEYGREYAEYQKRVKKRIIPYVL
jgi:protein-S-isoprenylcysteine O-methyltransferase Ste14